MNSHCGGHDLIHELRLNNGREFNKPDTIRKIVKQFLDCLESQPGLSHTAGSRQRKQAMFCQERSDVTEFLFAAHKRIQLLRQVVFWTGHRRLFQRACDAEHPIRPGVSILGEAQSQQRVDRQGCTRRQQFPIGIMFQDVNDRL